MDTLMLMADSAMYFLLVVGALICAYRAMTSPRILSATIYLACVSAAVATTLYLLGAFQVAVIELSVGAGLVTVLLVYAISVVGDDASDPGPVIPRPVAVGLTLLSVAMMGYMAYSLPSRDLSARVPPLVNALWQQRVLDVWIQMVLIFAGVMGILGLLAVGKEAQAETARHDGAGHRKIKVVPPTVCGFEPARALRAQEHHPDEVQP